jgi:hypothetical protein
VFAGALLAAISLSLLAGSAKTWPRFAAALLTAQAAVALALGILQIPLATVGSAWVSLQLILLTGLVSIQPPERSLARGIATISLGLVPPSAAFLGVWLALAALSGWRLLAIGVPLAVVAVLAMLAIARHWSLPRLDFRWPDEPWAGMFLVLALVPAPFTWGIVLPVARTVRAIPAGAFSVDWFGFAASGAHWPVTLAGLAALVVGAALWKLRVPAWSGPGVKLALPGLPESALVRRPALSSVPWLTLGWVLYGLVLAVTVQR